jgi:hypothetical protein
MYSIYKGVVEYACALTHHRGVFHAGGGLRHITEKYTIIYLFQGDRTGTC